MSTSSLSDGPPSDAMLEQTLRHVVQIVFKDCEWEELTVKRVRKAAEVELGLRDGFFKGNVWKERSKQIIEGETQIQENARENATSSQLPTPKAVEKIAGKPKPPKPENKRPAPSDSKPKKQLKTKKEGLGGNVPEDGASKISRNIPDGTIPKMTIPNLRAKAPEVVLADSERSNTADLEEAKKLEIPKADSESELSDVIDDEPKLKSRKRRPRSGESKAKGTQKKPKERQTTEKPHEADPDTEEIKRLQGWLIKCGVRKMWYKELAPFEGSKAKIRHLKSLLADAGMAGRYSAEKATQIKEARELKADLEAVQEGAKHWGKEISDEEDGVKPKRRLARGLQNLDFLNDDDGEETD